MAAQETRRSAPQRKQELWSFGLRHLTRERISLDEVKTLQILVLPAGVVDHGAERPDGKSIISSLLKNRVLR